MRRRRIALEWGVILTMGMGLALSTLWGSSYFIDDTLIYLRIPHPLDEGHDPRDEGHGLHFSLGNGDISLFNQVVLDGAGKFAPYVVTPSPPLMRRTQPDERISHVTIPGLDYHYYQSARTGYTVWSIRLSLLYPIMVLLLVAVVLGCRLKRRRRGMEAEGSSTAAR